MNQVGCSVGAADGVIGPKTRTWLRSLDSLWDDASFDSLMQSKRSEDILARVEILGQLVCKNAYSLSQECRSAYAKWKSRPGAGAFVADAAGGCASSSGYGSTDSASAEALKNCRKSGLPCKVIDTKRGSGSGEACRGQYSKFNAGKSHKAIALGSGTCYMVLGARTVARAKRDALAYCRREGGKNCKVVRSK